jgi:GT2 family glycosyltransferase
MPKPLVIVPQYLTEESDIEVTMDAVRSVRKTVSDSVDILAVDDCSPQPELVDAIRGGFDRYETELVVKDENSGFSKTVNVGLQRALDEGRDAVLLNADVEISTPGWVKICQKAKDAHDRPAAIVGALLLYPSGLIQHAGIYFSLLTRTFDHMYKFGPANLPEALRTRVCPVTAAFQYIRHDTLVKVGLYDENFHMAHEDVDYCVRVFLAELQCVYEPRVRGFHAEAMFRGKPSPKLAEWQEKSWIYFAQKYSTQSFAGMVPFV